MKRVVVVHYLYKYQKLSSVQIDIAIDIGRYLGDLYGAQKDRMTPLQIKKIKEKYEEMGIGFLS